MRKRERTEPRLDLRVDIYWLCASDTRLVWRDESHPSPLGEFIGLGEGVSAAVQTTTDQKRLSLWVPDV